MAAEGGGGARRQQIGGLEAIVTDAHNLYDRGFARESGLKTVPPGQTRRGSLTYSVRR